VDRLAESGISICLAVISVGLNARTRQGHAEAKAQLEEILRLTEQVRKWLKENSPNGTRL